jgi:menaquinol-cytochrome c reductase iron-sulfur subunit
MQTDATSTNQADPAARRSFVVRLAAVVAGAFATMFPFAIGWGVVTDPWRRARRAEGKNETDAANFSRVCPLESLPADGIPRPFAITADVSDAWTHSPAQRIGAVFLSRTSKAPNVITAFSATCPHLGCAVDFDPANNRFECPCHKSGFAPDGQKLFGPSLRGLDPLPVKVEEKAGAKEICVEFERFQAGIAERKRIE